MRKLLYALGLLAALVAGATLVPKRAREMEPPAQAASQASPTETPRPPYPPATPAQEKGFLGVVLARETVDIVPKTQGRVRTVRVRLGDPVNRNAVIATIEAETVAGELAMAEAEARQAEADHEKAKLEASQASERLARREPLAQGVPAISGEELESSRYQDKLAGQRLRAARALVAQKAARVKQLRALVAETELRAPFAGMVAARYVDPGAVVGPQTPIARLINPDDLWVRFAVPEDRSTAIAAGERVQVAIETLTAVPGVVEKVAPEVDAASRMIVAEAKLELPPSWRGQIRSGLVARVLVAPVAPARDDTLTPRPAAH
jgi:RND family efflux transporter MFP subunit